MEEIRQKARGGWLMLVERVFFFFFLKHSFSYASCFKKKLFVVFHFVLLGGCFQLVSCFVYLFLFCFSQFLLVFHFCFKKRVRGGSEFLGHVSMRMKETRKIMTRKP